MRLKDFSWALGRVLGDWQHRRPKQLRHELPPGYTTPILRSLRANACRYEAPKSVSCAKWSQTNPRLEDPTVTLDVSDFSAHQGPYSLTSEFVCRDCKNPYVSHAVLFDKLGLSEKNENFNERTWRRYVNEEKPIKVAQFRRAVSNAFLLGWLDTLQAFSIWQFVDQVDMARKGLLAVFQRASERKGFRLRPGFDISQEEIEREMEKQRRLLELEETRAIDQRLKAGDLPPDLRQMMEEALLIRRQEAAKRDQGEDDDWHQQRLKNETTRTSQP